MQKNLKIKWFCTYNNLVDFINENKITQENIQAIEERQGHIALLYWSYDD